MLNFRRLAMAARGAGFLPYELYLEFLRFLLGRVSAIVFLFVVLLWAVGRLLLRCR